VDAEWFRQNSFGEDTDPEPSRPLSDTFVQVGLFVEAGELTGVLEIPTVVDDEAEPAEHLRLYMMSWPPTNPDFELTGTVTD
jgi:hypothetical protein